MGFRSVLYSPCAKIVVQDSPNRIGHSTLEKYTDALMATVNRVQWVLSTCVEFHPVTHQPTLVLLVESLPVVPSLSQAS